MVPNVNSGEAPAGSVSKGIVSKRATSRYRSGRCLSWVKVKNPAYERRGGSLIALAPSV
jgi:ATP-dependent DNA ligase